MYYLYKSPRKHFVIQKRQSQSVQSPLAVQSHPILWYLNRPCWTMQFINIGDTWIKSTVSISLGQPWTPSHWKPQYTYSPNKSPPFWLFWSHDSLVSDLSLTSIECRRSWFHSPGWVGGGLLFNLASTMQTKYITHLWKKKKKSSGEKQKQNKTKQNKTKKNTVTFHTFLSMTHYAWCPITVCFR